MQKVSSAARLHEDALLLTLPIADESAVPH